MSWKDLREFIDHLESQGDLVRITREVDPVQDITIIQHRVLEAGGPALLFENVKGSPYRLVTNLFGTAERVRAVFGRDPAEIGEQLASLSEQLMPPSGKAVWKSRKLIWTCLKARMRTVKNGPILESEFSPPQLDQLPCLTCWPLDGGPFFTLPLVHTVDPVDGRGNLGIYRMQRYDSNSTGMHWQIEKGGGFHFDQACKLGQSLPISVFLGGPPALTIAAITPLPEGLDERLLAALIMGSPLDVILRKGSQHKIPASAEFVLEGSVSPGDLQHEGPFGDHLGHYSHSADFPVFRVKNMLARKDAIYPATVVGKPVQEDYFIGEALQELTLPLLKCIKPGIHNLWAYPETGFHPLAVMSVRETYRHEGMKHAFSVLGEGQLSLTKVLIVVDDDVDVRDFEQVGNAIYENFDPTENLLLLAPTAQDTLDFTGPAINMGSRMVIMATRKNQEPERKVPPGELTGVGDLHKDILELSVMNRAMLIVQVVKGGDLQSVREALFQHPVTSQYLFHVLVSEDVPMNDQRLMLWGWFTRFDPISDVYAFRSEQDGNRLKLHAPICINATWKEGYRKPVKFDPDRLRKIEEEWDSYGIKLP